MKLLVISPAHQTQLDKAQPMIKTARRVGIEPVMYGLTSTHPHGKDYQGSDIVDLLRQRTDAEFVMGVDAPDVAFLAGEDEILSKLEQFKHPFVMSCERTGVSGNTNMRNKLAEMCIAAGGLHSQPNIGGWIGEREYVLKCFNEAEQLYKDKPEDPNYSYDNHHQWLCMLKAWGGGPEFDLDWNCKIFQSMDQAPTETIEKRGLDGVSRRVRNTSTGTWPCVLHYNGDPTRGAFNEMVRWILED